MYDRLITPLLESELLTSETTVITGMRQVGKTTLLNHLFSKIKSDNKAMFDFENPMHRKIFEENNYDAIWQNLAQFGISNQQKAYLLLDEIQNLPIISSVIKYLHDHYQIKFIVTGSSSYYLKNLFPESQAGRKLIFEVYPLTFSEFLVFKNMPKIQHATFVQKFKSKNRIAYNKYITLYREYIEYGGFPKVVLENDHKRKAKLLSEIFTSYFEHDVKTLADLSNLGKLRDLILLLLPRIGSKIEISKISASLGITRQTVYNYLTFLEQTYFIYLIPKYSNNIDRQTSGIKKLYLCDSGLANILGKLSEGQAFEQSVFQNIRQSNDICYFNNNQSEIDFIFNKQIALEVKVAYSKQQSEFLKRRCNNLGLKEYYLVTLDFNNDPHSIFAIDL